jgi:hypothetical protein
VASDAIEHDRSLIWPMRTLQGAIINAQAPSLAVTEVPDVLAALTCWLHKNELLAKLDGLVTEEQDDAVALSATERETRSAVVMGDLLAVEYDEARLVEQAQADKLPCEHRSDCAAQAILQVRLVTATRLERPARHRDIRGTCGGEHDRAAGGCCLLLPGIARGARAFRALSPSRHRYHRTRRLERENRATRRAGTSRYVSCPSGRVLCRALARLLHPERKRYR